MKMANIKLAYKLTALVGFCLAAISTITLISLQINKENLLTDRKQKTRHVVESAHSTIAYFHDQAVKGSLTMEQAKARAASALKTMRYGEGDYFWINDMQPKMVMHPYSESLVGQDLSNYTDPNGKKLFVAMVTRGQEKRCRLRRLHVEQKGLRGALPEDLLCQRLCPLGLGRRLGHLR